MDTKELRTWIKPLIEPLIPTFREVFAVSAFVNILALSSPIFVMQVYDRVIGHQGLTTLQGLVIGILCLVVFDYVLRQTRSRVMQTVALRIDIEVGRRLFEKIMVLPLRTLENAPASSWQQLFRDVDVVRNTLSGASAILVCDLPFAILFLGVVFIIAFPLAWVLLIALICFILLAWRAGISVASASDDEKKAMQTRDGLLAETIIGRGTIKALSLDHALRPVWEERTATAIEESLHRGHRTDGFVNLGSVFTMTTTIAMTTVGALAIIDQNMTMGGLVAANMLSGRLLGPFNQLVGQWKNFSGFRQSVERLGNTFASASDNTESAIALERPKGAITVEDVTFRYDEKGPPAVDAVQMVLVPGGLSAILGQNGSGKSTLIKLILGLYTPEEGRILLDGADMAQFTRHELSRWIGYVPQDTVLFTGTIRDNIANGAPNTTDEQVIEAAKLAGVHAMILDLPDGYGTGVGEAGMRMSGGMRQRISIARALIGDPPVLLLDEPSGSLDRQAEEELRSHLLDLARERTVVLVTHSPVLLSVCQTVAVMDRGKLAAMGPAQDILPRLMGKPPPEKPAAAKIPLPKKDKGAK